MNILDMKTVLFSFVISNAICAVVMSSLWLQYRRRITATGFWLAGLIVAFLSMLLLALRGTIPDFLSIVIANGLIITGFILIGTGVERYAGQTLSQRHNYILLAVFIFAQGYFTYSQPSLLARKINVSLVILIICSQYAWFIMRRVDAEMRRTTMIAGLVFTTYSLVSVVRIYLDLSGPPESGLLQSNWYDTLVMIIYQMLIITVSFAIILMVNHQLFVELEQDLAERKSVEEALRVAEETYRNIFLNSQIGLFRTDRQTGLLLDANDTVARFIGYPDRASLLAEHVRMVERYVDSHDREKMLALVQAHGAIHNFETRFRKNDGSIIWIRASARLIQDKDWMEGVAEDITERKQTEEALRVSEEKHRILLEESSDPIFSFTPEGRYTFVNKAFTAGVGKSVADIIGKTIWDVFPKEEAEKRFASLSQVFQTGEQKVIDVRVPRTGGDFFYITTITPIKDTSGKVITAICSSKDITARRLLEEELLKARKLESVGTLAGGIAHDFNNLLAAIQGYIEMAKDNLPSGSCTHGYLLDAEQSAHQAAELTKLMITFSKGGEPVKSPRDIGNLIKDTVSRAIINLSVEKKVTIPNNLWPAEVDEGQICQTIRNIINNAAEAMPKGGLIDVSAENVTVSGPNQLPVPDGPYVRIAIIDRGEGIAADDLPLIFDPYFSTKQRGTQKGMGLGLSVCHSIVSKHGGCIIVESSLGQGSSFYIYLPALIRKKQDEKLPQPASTPVVPENIGN